MLRLSAVGISGLQAGEDVNNCIRSGPVSQNRDAHPDFRAHFAGRVAHAAALNAARGAKLRALFDRIAWDADGAGR